MSKPILHYIYDPLCGWCYAAEPLIQAAQALERFELVLHGGGLMRGQRVVPAMRQHIVSSDRRIAQLTGQPFGEAYLNGLIQDPDTVMDSLPPITAIRAVEALAGDGLAMHVVIQHAHYVDGRRVSELDTLVELAVGLGLEAEAFHRVFAQQSESVMGHIDDTRRMLDANGGGGFPTLLLETEGGLRRLEISNYYGQTQRWSEFLHTLLSR
ncbi:DsbA family protein [Marinobacterium zhoushanense]|uniref:DsbA family protein n=1 Tax=Marinobacterium zhoushanense TaxID=1679163 RepID=A0ABQ1K270_9GAMM|nr:DsbA family protein [Marinobacterium zhoushanense]GGB84829.1 DsbA family protein [Marinobacterium zhoushanense]